MYTKHYENYFDWYTRANEQKHTYHIVTPSPWPISGAAGALSLTIGGVLYFHNFKLGGSMVLLGLLIILLVMYVWWRDTQREGTWLGSHTLFVRNGLKIGIILFILSEILFFSAFFWAFFHSSLAPTVQIGSTWPPKGIIPLDPYGVPLLNTLILLLSGITLTFAHHALRMNEVFYQIIGLWITIILAVEFTIYQGMEYINAPFSISDGVYGATFFMSTGFHGFHVIIGTILLIVCSIRMFLGHFTPTHHVGYEIAIWYWHFVDGVWLFLFIVVYCWGFGF